jgi:hypothetical protein
MNEVWKDIKGYENLYQISSMGRVKSLERIMEYYRNGKKQTMRIPETILTPIIDNNGYSRVTLFRNSKRKMVFIHRLVGEAFIPNPENKPCIDHINTIRDDNRVENLRFCTYSENNLNPLTLERFKSWVGINNKFSKQVIQFDLNGELIRKWDCITDVKRELGIEVSQIGACCAGKRKTASGSKWKYYDTDTYLIALMVKNLKAKGIILRNAS